jgi:hypothetical protein
MEWSKSGVLEGETILCQSLFVVNLLIILQFSWCSQSSSAVLDVGVSRPALPSFVSCSRAGVAVILDW